MSNTCKQYVKENGRRFLITTPPYEMKEGPKFMMNNNITSVLVPLCAPIVAELQRVENFVKENVDSPRYKPLWLFGNMYVNVSKFCNYEVIDGNNYAKPLLGDVTFGNGWYTFQIHVSHVYIGPHRGGETFSLSLHVTRISYQPQDTIEEALDNLMQSLEPAPKCDTKTEKKRRRRNKSANADQSVVSE